MSNARTRRNYKFDQALTAAEDARLRTWADDIVRTVLPDLRWRDTGSQRRYEHTGGLCVHLKRGCWFLHGEGRGNWSLLPLIQRLKGCSVQESVDWAKAWLSTHKGTGAADSIDYEDPEESFAHILAAQTAKDFMSRREPLIGSPAETYLHGRGLPPPYPDSLTYIPHARIGEGALLVELHDHDAVVGVHVVYVDAEGNKSLIKPRKQTFLADRKRGRAGVMQLTPNASSKTTLLCEGVEDGLSLMLAHPECKVIALPGVGVLRHISVRRGERIIVARDGDEKDSHADKALHRGMDNLLLQDADVYVTDPVITDCGCRSESV